MRLVDEILTQSAYIGFGNIDPVEYVAISNKTLDAILSEIKDESDVEEITIEELESILTLKILIIPNSIGIDYRFFKEINP